MTLIVSMSFFSGKCILDDCFVFSIRNDISVFYIFGGLHVGVMKIMFHSTELGVVGDKLNWF